MHTGFKFSSYKILEHGDWYDQAACKGMNPEIFFPERGEASEARKAKRVCEKCPVKRQCLQTAIINKETRGIWGGLSGRRLRFAIRTRSIPCTEVQD